MEPITAIFFYMGTYFKSFFNWINCNKKFQNFQAAKSPLLPLNPLDKQPLLIPYNPSQVKLSLSGNINFNSTLRNFLFCYWMSQLLDVISRLWHVFIIISAIHNIHFTARNKKVKCYWQWGCMHSLFSSVCFSSFP